jgi:LysM repeat protein
MLKPATYALLGLALFVGAALVLSTTLRHDAIAASGPEAEIRPTPTRAVHRVLAGETLSSISRDYYGTAAGWQEIARINGLGSPQSLRAGDLIVIPELPSVPANRTTPVEIVRQFALQTATGSQAFAAVTTSDSMTSIRYFIRDDAGSRQTSCADFPTNLCTFKSAWASDVDGDGVDELYTIWEQGGNPAFTRLFRQTASGLVLASESDYSPVAPLMELPEELRHLIQPAG